VTLTRLLCAAAFSLSFFRCRCLAMKLGAVQVSLYGLQGPHQPPSSSHQFSLQCYGMIVLGIACPRILLAIFVGASLSCRRQLPGFASQSAGRSVRARVSFRCRSWLLSSLSFVEGRLDLSPEMAGLITPVAHSSAPPSPSRRLHPRRRDGQIDSTTLLLGGIITACSFRRSLCS